MTTSELSDKAWLILDALDIHVAVLDNKGLITYTNRAWNDFATANPLADGSAPLHVGIGTNYLEICRSAAGYSAENAHKAYLGICEVLAGKKRHFSLEYPCHSETVQRWFVMKVTPLKGARPRHVTIVHSNITAQKLAEFSTDRKTQELTHALESLENFAGQLKTALKLDRSIQTPRDTSIHDATSPLKKSLPLDAERLSLLSKREKEVLIALARGERVADIAERLSLSVKSVSTYRSRLLEKLQVRTTAELATFMTRLGIL